MKREVARYIFSPQVAFSRFEHTSLGGLDDQGNFKTAVAKVYPPSMCLALARACLDVCNAASQSSSDEPWHATDDCDDLKPYYTQFDPYSQEGTMGCDYARHAHTVTHHHDTQTTSADISRRIAVNSAIAAHRRVLTRQAQATH